ncbi:UDP-N-acetylglucosamine transferase subunit alg14 [Halteromyces radiatus]|uniref:UDP-N-acetylglucosamine transferase subunit alg14 n=1 Tax=Halteromyces radiatus TaxID=101107 RepID=UPI00221EF7B4|nr:UDP-N-acetylglucosamine transferase subunit alg14 [Halteromyces radiatus]KAI8085162.1 UDP-N-acetylglucosamine transferase subunit alg14 [Halteromyces radiatus]
MIWLHLIILLSVLRLWMILPNQQPSKKKRIKPCATCIVLGSGGHTAEMEQLVKGLDENKYQPRNYVYCNNDPLSQVKMQQLEHDLFPHTVAQTKYYEIPRARNVGQSLVSVPITFMMTFLRCFSILLTTMPDTIICNGPGSCIPLCMLAYIPRFFGIKHITLVYVESCARVYDLSLTGRLLYGWVDLFFVQWPDLKEKYPKAQYHGILV